MAEWSPELARADTQAQQRRYADRQRNRAKAILGGCCVQCGITHPVEFDHINNDGGGRYAINRNGNNRLKMWNGVINGTRTDIQLLCSNCNRLKQIDPDEFAKPPSYGPIKEITHR